MLLGNSRWSGPKLGLKGVIASETIISMCVRRERPVGPPANPAPCADGCDLYLGPGWRADGATRGQDLAAAGSQAGQARAGPPGDSQGGGGDIAGTVPLDRQGRQDLDLPALAVRRVALARRIRAGLQ